jgi:5-methylcytosine-specific restriction endonuclease McrA
MTYSQKLRDPRWQKKRLQILERDNWTCQSCRSTTKNLQVHHLVYRKIDPWDYADECYQTLCEDCHPVRQELTDKAIDAFRIRLKYVPNERLAVVAQKMMDGAMEELA